MASSLDPDNFPESGKRMPKGHGNRSLGPGDSSDSGSDLAGPGLFDDEGDVLDLDRDPIEDMETDQDAVNPEEGSLSEDRTGEEDETSTDAAVL
jgi:hypothetical protein